MSQPNIPGSHCLAPLQVAMEEKRLAEGEVTRILVVQVGDRVVPVTVT